MLRLWYSDSSLGNRTMRIKLDFLGWILTGKIQASPDYFEDFLGTC